MNEVQILEHFKKLKRGTCIRFDRVDNTHRHLKTGKIKETKLSGTHFYTYYTYYISVEWDDGYADASGSWYVNPDNFIILGDNIPVVQSTDSTVAVNDYICPTCRNNRCSRSEKTCWKCGNQL